MQTKASIFNALKQELQLQGGIKNSIPIFDKDTTHHPFESLFPNHIFPIGAVHEFIVNNNTQLAASAGFVAALITSFIHSKGPLVWVGQQLQIFPNGLCAYNITPENILFIEPKSENDLLWCTEEALRCNGVAAVIAIVNGVDFKYSRRLQLAVEKSNVTGFVLNTNGKLETNNAFVTRWKIQHSKSVQEKQMLGVGMYSWQAELLKIRNGLPKNCNIFWNKELKIVAEKEFDNQSSVETKFEYYG